MRAVVYARVSSDRQRERHTIASQLRELPAYVKREGWTLVDTLVDDGISGETVDARPGFLRVLELAEARAFDVLVVIDHDRITRAKKSAEGALIYDTLRESKVKIAVPGQNVVDLDDEDQDFFVSIRREMAKWEKRKILRRMDRGRREAARQGRRFGCRDPYGFEWKTDETLASRGRYVIRPSEAKIVRRMVAMALDGEGVSVIVATLNREGVRTRKGAPWRASSAYKILRASTIKGSFRVFKGSAETILAVPPIVSDEQWGELQASLSGRRTKARYERLPIRCLLSGVARCGVCDRAIWVVRGSMTTRQKRREYYRCSSVVIPGTCGNVFHRVDEVDALVWDEIRRAVKSPAILAQAVAKMSGGDGKGVDWGEQLGQCKRRLAQLELLEGENLARRRRGLLSAGACDAELETIAKERAMVQRNAEMAQAELAGVAAHASRIRGVKDLVAKLRLTVDAASQEDRAALVRAIAKPPAGRVLLHADRTVEVRGILALDTEAVPLAFVVQQKAG